VNYGPLSFSLKIKEDYVKVDSKASAIGGWGIDRYGLCGVLPVSPVAVSTPEQSLELIPMGAARLRISAFPVVGN
jgi:hypothetical protein